MLRTRVSLMYQVTMTGVPYSSSCQVVILSKFNPFCFIKKCKQMKTKLRCGRHAGKYRYINSDMQNVIGMYNDNKIAISLCHEVFKLQKLQRMLLVGLICCNGNSPPSTERRLSPVQSGRFPRRSRHSFS